MSLQVIAYETIREQIFEQSIEPGSRILIDHIAKDLSMSITPVREALARLAADGLVYSDPNKGFTVAPLLSSAEFHDLFYCRAVIERAALGSDGIYSRDWLATVSDAEIGELTEVVHEMEKLGATDVYQDYSRFSLLDHQFHRQLIQMTGNTFLLAAWEGTHFHLHMSRLYAGRGIVDSREAEQEHFEILQAIIARDRTQIVESSSKHLEGAEVRLLPLLQSGNS